jgi:hypothetical protein
LARHRLGGGLVTGLVPLRRFGHARARVAGSALVVTFALNDSGHWHLVREGATAARVQAWFGAFRPARATRTELAGLAAFQFVLEAAAGAGRGHDLSVDPAGRVLAQRLLEMPISVPVGHPASALPPR